MDEPPLREHREDRHQAEVAGWRLAVGPAVFLIHFSAVYGFNGLACAFGWHRQTVAGLPLVPSSVVMFTLLTVGLLWAVLPTAPRRAAPDVQDPYDPSARRHFIRHAGRLTVGLAAAGTVAVAAMALLARTCG